MNELPVICPICQWLESGIDALHSLPLFGNYDKRHGIHYSLAAKTYAELFPKKQKDKKEKASSTPKKEEKKAPPPAAVVEEAPKERKDPYADLPPSWV